VGPIIFGILLILILENTQIFAYVKIQVLIK